MSETVKSKRPPDTAFCQQKLTNWSLSTSPYAIIILSVFIIVLGIIFIPIGSELYSKSLSVDEYVTYYDGDNSARSDCRIDRSNEGRQCLISFKVDHDISGPLFVYYQLDNFYQNHRRYFMSKSIPQLQGQGQLGDRDVSLDCEPLLKNGSILLNPCGLIANSFFNDVIKLHDPSGKHFLLEEGIALRSDRDEMFKQVAGFAFHPVRDANVTCQEAGLLSGCKDYTDPMTQQAYKFYYPDEESTQYLYESYPQISPLKGVEDEHFIVWMRTEAFPTFRKLYGKISGIDGFRSGETIVFNITANYEVNSYKGSKAILLSSLGDYGGRNRIPGDIFVVAGSLSLTLGVVLLVTEAQKFGALKYLVGR